MSADDHAEHSEENEEHLPVNNGQDLALKCPASSSRASQMLWKFAMKLSLNNDNRMLQQVSRSMLSRSNSHRHRDERKASRRPLERHSISTPWELERSSEATQASSRSSLSHRERESLSPLPSLPPMAPIEFQPNSRKRSRGLPLSQYQKWPFLGIRPGLSVRVVRAEINPGVTSTTEYVLQVVDLHTKVFWIVKKRFHEIYLLRKKIRAIIRQADPATMEELRHILELPFPRRRFRHANAEAISHRMETLEVFLRNVAAVEPSSLIHVAILTEFHLEMCSSEFIASLQKIDTSNEEIEPKWLLYELFILLNGCGTVEGYTCYKFIQSFRNRCAIIEAAVCPQCKNFAGTSLAVEALKDLRNVITNIQKYVMDNLQPKYSVALALRAHIINVASILEEVVFQVVEDTIVVPLEKNISFLVGVTIDADVEERLGNNIQRMRGKSQSELGIPEHLQSDDNWGKSCHHLSMIDEKALPNDKINELLTSALEIFKSCGEKNLEWKESSALTADDYLPIHIYVVIHSGLKRPLMTKELLGAMIHPSKMLGEVGYFLTMFEVALQYISDM